MSNRRNALLLCLIALFATNAIAQDPEPLPLPSRDLDRALTPDEKERVLRGGVLTLFGSRLPQLTPDQRTQLSTTSATPRRATFVGSATPVGSWEMR